MKPRHLVLLLLVAGSASLFGFGLLLARYWPADRITPTLQTWLGPHGLVFGLLMPLVWCATFISAIWCCIAAARGVD